jgi:hypothetical protein
MKAVRVEKKNACRVPLSEKSQRDKRKQAVEGLIHHHAKTGNHNAMLIRAALVCGRSVRSIIPNDLKFESVAADRGFDFSRSVLERGSRKKVFAGGRFDVRGLFLLTVE